MTTFISKEKTIYIQNEIELAQLLREAAEAHHSFEVTLGHADEKWPEWYAEHIARVLQTREQEARAREERGRQPA